MPEPEDFGAFSGVPLPDPTTLDGAMRIVRSVQAYHAVPSQAFHMAAFTLLKELEKKDDYADAIH